MAIVELQNYEGEDRIISSIEMGEEIRRVSKGGGDVFRGGIPTLDTLLNGFAPGELVTISGITKNGKTTLARSLTVAFEKAGLFCLWFTYELPPKQFMDTFPTVPFFYLPRRLKSADMDWVEARIMEGLQKYHTRVVFIDHLHYLFDLARSKNVSLDIGSVVRRLKLIAVREEVVIFLMAHTIKPKMEVAEMGFEGIRDSSIVSQESDVVLMVRRRPDVSDTAAEVSVEFSRRTGAMKKKVYMCMVGGLLRESAYEFTEPKQERVKKVKRYLED